MDTLRICSGICALLSIEKLGHLSVFHMQVLAMYNLWPFSSSLRHGSTWKPLVMKCFGQRWVTGDPTVNEISTFQAIAIAARMHVSANRGERAADARG